MQISMQNRKRVSKALWVAGIFVVLIGLVATWRLLQNTGPYNSLRSDVRSIGVQRLQAWAVSVLDNPPKVFGIGPDGTIRPEDIPSDLRPLMRGFVVYEPDRPDTQSQEHILFACGGGFFHYGLRVGRPGYEPASDMQFRFEKLGDGVWGMYER